MITTAIATPEPEERKFVNFFMTEDGELIFLESESDKDDDEIGGQSNRINLS